jgi:DNA invertase Pin-like site-specific DNA recombinase
MTTTATRKAIAYVRVSTDEQGQSGLGLEAQTKTIADYCAAHGIEVIDTATEVQSGKSIRNRPALRNALERAAKGEADLVIASNVSRLARSVADLSGMLEVADRKGYGLCAIDTGLDSATPAGRLVIQMLAAAAEYERRMVSDRTKKALAAAKARGTQLGRKTELAPAIEAQIVARRTSGMAFATIARELNEAGITTPRGASWSAPYVHKVIARNGDPITRKAGRPHKVA